MKKVRFFDSTLRDGAHTVKQQISEQQIESYCKMVDEAGMYTVIVGHGNGIGASSILMGRTLVDELEMLKIASSNLNKTTLGTFVTVGFGTIADQILPAIQKGASLFCIATHSSEADTTKKYIEFLTDKGIESYGVLMNIHLTATEKLVEQAKLIQSYGADGIILMDSAGALTPENVSRAISSLYDKVNIDIGFHPHNNMGIAVSNAYTAIKNGASIIDGTIGGFGAGAGNCQLEALQALLLKENILTNTDLYKMLDIEREIISKMFNYHKGVDSTSIISGYAGVVSTFKTRVEEVAKIYKLDARDIFVELGKRKAISGQDDLILEVSQYLLNSK